MRPIRHAAFAILFTLAATHRLRILGHSEQFASSSLTLPEARSIWLLDFFPNAWPHDGASRSSLKSSRRRRHRGGNWLRQRPRHHTLLFSFAGLITINPLIHEKLSYDPARDIVPISSAAVNFFAIAAAKSLNVNSLAEFLALARSQPGKLNWAATPDCPNTHSQRFRRGAGLKYPPGCLSRLRSSATGFCRGTYSGPLNIANSSVAASPSRQGENAPGDHARTLSAVAGSSDGTGGGTP